MREFSYSIMMDQSINHLEYRGTGVSIYSTKDIIKKIDITILINSSGKLNPLLLTTTQVNPTLSDFSMISEFHHFQVFLQATHLNYFLVFWFIHWQTEQNVLLDCPILNPCRLWNICSASTHPHLFHISTTKFITCCQSSLLRSGSYPSSFYILQNHEDPTKTNLYLNFLVRPCVCSINYNLMSIKTSIRSQLLFFKHES